MNEFVDIEILGGITGCSMLITLFTQVFKRYLPNNIDTKWLALLFSIIIGVLRIIYISQYDFNGIVSGIFNIFVLLSIAIGVYELANSAAEKIIDSIGGTNNDEK